MVVLGCALVAGGLAFVAPWEVGVAAALSAWLVGRSCGWLASALVVLGVTVGAVRASHAVDAYESARSLGPPARCAASALVVSAPVRVHGSMRFDARVDDAACESGEPWRGIVTLYGGSDAIARGDRIDVIAQVGSPQRLWNDATGDPRPGEARRGIVKSGSVVDEQIVEQSRSVFSWIDRARAHVRRRIDATFPADTAPMARALVLGESDLAEGDDAAFRASGLAHLLAVSGMHLVIVVLGALAALHAVLARVETLAARVDVGRVAAIVVLPLACAYAAFAGAGGSTVRAAWMLGAGLVARALGRRSDGPRAFGLSLVAMAILDPLVAFDLSFALSAAATAGLLFASRPLADAVCTHLPSLKPLAWFARSIATTLAATLPCAPILARFAPTMPLASAFANMLAVPLGETMALPLCLAHAMLAPWPAAERGCATTASGALTAVRAIARASASTTWLSMNVPPPTAWQLAAIVVAVVAFATMRAGARRAVLPIALAAVLVLELRARRDGSPHDVLRATFLDVGQGDAAIVDLPDGRAMVIDGGGLVGSPVDVGARVLAPALRARRRGDVAIAVMSHPHPDHFGGLTTGLAAVRVGALWDTGQGERDGAGPMYAAVLASARARGVAIVRPQALCGDHVIGGARVEVLAPCPGPLVDVGANDNSFVIRISLGARAFLFVGDAEHEEEASLLRLGASRLRADVLKVGHHGSRTSSSSAFLAAVSPTDAILSTGVRNRFGHPHPTTLSTLARAHIRVWRTDHDGAITATTDGRSLTFAAANGRSGDR